MTIRSPNWTFFISVKANDVIVIFMVNMLNVLNISMFVAIILVIAIVGLIVPVLLDGRSNS